MTLQEKRVGLIIGVAPRAEKYARWEILSGAQGFFAATVPQKLALPYGLFDEVEVSGTLKGKGFFAQEIHLHKRADGLVKNFAALEEASRLAKFLQQAFRETSDYASLHEIFAKAMNYYCEAKSPTLVSLKALYKILLAEGFAVEQDWLDRQSAEMREILMQPIDGTLDASVAMESLYRWAGEELGV